MRLIFWVFICALLAGCGIFQREQETIVVIQPLEIGVVTDSQTGEILEILYADTYQLDSQTQSVTFYFTGQQEYTMMSDPPDGWQTQGDAIDTVSLDGQEIGMDISLLYAIDPAQIETIHLTWGQNYAEDLIRPVSRSLVRETAREFTAEQVYGEARADLETQMQERITERLSEEGFILVDLLVRDIQFTEEFARSMEATLVHQIQSTRDARATEYAGTPTP